MKNKLIIMAAVAVMAVALTQKTQATPILGNIGFSGTAQLDGSTVETSTKVLSWINNSVGGATGTFLSADPTIVGSSVNLVSPWLFNSGAINNFWVAGAPTAFTFNLLSSSVVPSLPGFLNVVLTGTVTAPGYDATPFTGKFTVQDPVLGGQFNFTESISFQPVPDGGTTALLLGAALSGLALVKRKFIR